jgi:CO/xanthine dehydrogenase Mo-binding subunit
MTGEAMFDAHFKELLGRAATWIGWDHAEPPVREGNIVRAKGLSCIIKGTVTPSTSSASVKLNDDGSLDVLTSSVEMGQGMQASFAILAAERLGIPVGAVHISSPDTDITPYDQQTSSSRTTHAMGTAIIGAIDEVRRQLRDLAADQLEAAVDDLELAEGTV